MNIAGPFETDLPMTLTVTGSTVAVALLNSGCQVRPPPPPPPHPPLLPVYQLWARLRRHPVKLPKSTCFQGSRKEEVSVIREDKGTLSVCHMDLGRACVCIYCTLWGLGHTPPRCFTLGTNISLHPAPIKEHKELFDSLYKPNMTNNCIVYCVIPPRLPWLCTAHHRSASDCSVLCLFGESNDLYRPLLMKCEW